MRRRQWLALGGLAATIGFAMYMVLQLDAERDTVSELLPSSELGVMVD